MTLYEEGFFKNGLNPNGTFQLESSNKARDIIKKVVNATKEELSIEHTHFVSYVEKNTPGKSNVGSSKLKHSNHVMIAEHFLTRLSLGNEARITAINLNKIPEVNKKKIGINLEKTVLLIVGAYEINHDQKNRCFGKMRNEAEKFESKIGTIISIFEDPRTPKETLLKYLANSYGLLEKIIGEIHLDHNNLRGEENSDEYKR